MLYKFECSFESECIASTGAVVTLVPRIFQPRHKGHPRLNRSQIHSDSKNNLGQHEDIIPEMEKQERNTKNLADSFPGFAKYSVQQNDICFLDSPLQVAFFLF